MTQPTHRWATSWAALPGTPPPPSLHSAAMRQGGPSGKQSPVVPPPCCLRSSSLLQNLVANLMPTSCKASLQLSIPPFSAAIPCNRIGHRNRAAPPSLRLDALPISNLKPQGCIRLSQERERAVSVMLRQPSTGRAFVAGPEATATAGSLLEVPHHPLCPPPPFPPASAAHFPPCQLFLALSLGGASIRQHLPLARMTPPPATAPSSG